MTLASLKGATDLRDVAKLLEVKTGMLSYVLYKQSKSELYRKFDISKKTGGVREISAPCPHLKLIQQRLAAILADCSSELRKMHTTAVQNKNHVRREVSHGFVKGRSIISNGQEHITRRFVFNADLSDFFGTINFGRVRGFFIKDENFLLSPSVATILAQIACNENKLPQGSPCSPVISNLIGHILDMRLVELAFQQGCTYTRYADDLTFSTNKLEFPTAIAIPKEGDPHGWLPGNGLRTIVQKCGFSLNEKKTRLQYRDSHQEVTGLTVNKKVNVPANYRYSARAMANNLFKTGQFQHVVHYADEKGAKQKLQRVGHAAELLGMLSYIDRVDVYNFERDIENGSTPLGAPGRLETYRRALYYDNFYAPSKPVVVCEGKTDNTYLKHAIRQLSGLYPTLASVPTAGGKPELSIRLYKYADRRSAVVTDIGGGVGGLCHLIKHYHADVSTRFRAPRPMHPVILLIDNDQGADSIYGAISGILRIKKPKGLRPFIHLFSNLYVVPTPLGPNKEQTMIEDFFDTATQAITLNGKTFSRKDEDSSKHYGKAAFARDVVAKHAESIDFNGFRPILDRLRDVLLDYATRP
jgi:RNA-directed DNA polymerase